MQRLAVRASVSSVQRSAHPAASHGFSMEAADAINCAWLTPAASKICRLGRHEQLKTLLEDYLVTGQFYSHLSPKLEARPVPEKGGMGVFAREPMGKDELMVLWGGRILLRTQCGFQRPDRAGCYVRYPARRRGLFRLRHV